MLKSDFELFKENISKVLPSTKKNERLGNLEKYFARGCKIVPTKDISDVARMELTQGHNRVKEYLRLVLDSSWHPTFSSMGMVPYPELCMEQLLEQPDNWR